MSDHLLLPEETVCKRIDVPTVVGKFDWWRVEDKKSGAILGSGFDRDSAIENAWNELLRRRNL